MRGFLAEVSVAEVSVAAHEASTVTVEKPRSPTYFRSSAAATRALAGWTLFRRWLHLPNFVAPTASSNTQLS